MAAGVGKTYRMLQEGQAEARNGRDVVIGYLEPHDRAETSAQAEGLEVVPRRQVTYREVTTQEFNVPAVLQRSPELCLIDELAHTNAPGSEHEKRYEDIEDVLEAGIDVYSTVNVQHLESLNDIVAELTGVRVRETFPDSALASADEVVLVDLTPEALIQRLRDGKIYRESQIGTALNNFFRAENLATLREVALRQVADEVEQKRIVPSENFVSTREDRLITSAPQAVNERLLALVTPRPSSQRLVRRAWRTAERLGAELDVLHIARSGTSAEDNEQLRALHKLSSILGAHFIIENGDEIADVVERVIKERGTTFVFLGETNLNTGMFNRFRDNLLQKLIRRLPGIDILIVADRTKRKGWKQ